MAVTTRVRLSKTPPSPRVPFLLNRGVSGGWGGDGGVGGEALQLPHPLEFGIGRLMEGPAYQSERRRREVPGDGPLPFCCSTMVGSLSLAPVTGSPSPLSLPCLWLLPGHQPNTKPHWDTSSSVLLVLGPSLCSPRGPRHGSMGCYPASSSFLNCGSVN